MEIIIVVAYGRNIDPDVTGNRKIVIGKDNKLPWRLRDDMEHFKTLTMGHAVVMGRKTYESIPENWRPLPGRKNVIITKNENYGVIVKNTDVKVVNSPHEAIKFCLKERFEKVFITGGEQIYHYFLEAVPKRVNAVIATEIDGDFEGDTYFRKSNLIGWDKKILSGFETQEKKNSHSFMIVEYRSRG